MTFLGFQYHNSIIRLKDTPEEQYCDGTAVTMRMTGREALQH